MPHSLPDDLTGTDRESAEESELTQLLRDFFAKEVPAEIREVAQDPTAPTASLPSSRLSRRSRRWRASRLVAVGLTVCGLALFGWWMSASPGPDSKPHLATDTNIPAPASAKINPPPVEAARPAMPVDPFAPRLTRHLEPSDQTLSSADILVEWARVRLFDAASATRIQLEIPTELRISPGMTGASLPTDSFVLARSSPLKERAESDFPSDAPVVAPHPVFARRNYLGVFAAPPGPLSKTQHFAPLGGASGLEILDVLPNSPAEAAGLRSHEILVAFNGEPLDSVARLAALIARETPGATVRLDIAGPQGFRTVEAVIEDQAFATGWSASREWRLPGGMTLRGHDTLVLTTTGWPIRPSKFENKQPGLAVWLSPHIEHYELRRLSSHDGQLSATRVWQGNPAELNARHVPSSSRRLTETLREAWENLTDAPAEWPLCRIQWATRDGKPVLELFITWEAPSGKPAMLAGVFPLRNDPTESLAWLLQEPAIQDILGKMPVADREFLKRSLKTIEFPSVQRTVRPVQ